MTVSRGEEYEQSITSTWILVSSCVLIMDDVLGCKNPQTYFMEVNFMLNSATRDEPQISLLKVNVERDWWPAGRGVTWKTSCSPLSGRRPERRSVKSQHS